jgi:hypothetical protein
MAERECNFRAAIMAYMETRPLQSRNKKEAVARLTLEGMKLSSSTKIRMIPFPPIELARRDR